jgi:DNA-binding CsgD family transcriptional regulator
MPDLLPRSSRGLVPLAALGGVVVLVVFGFARGVWSSNLHNGLLALAFATVGAYVSAQRPTHRSGRLFVATGVIEAVLFFGRQAGHAPGSSADRWWAWLGVWLLGPALALTTLAIVCFPDGKLPTPRWRWLSRGVGLVVVVSTVLSALWPVAYSSAGVMTVHPIHTTAPGAVKDIWATITYPMYVVLQVLWVAALTARWRVADPTTRGQLSLLIAAAAASLVALAVGLIGFGTHVPGVLAAALVPVAAGWAIVEGRRLATYRALSWLSRTSPGSDQLPDELTRTAAEALRAPGARLWMGGAEGLHLVGTWPPTDHPDPTATLSGLRDIGERCVRALQRDGSILGALTVEGVAAADLTRGEEQLFDDLAGQAAWVIEHLTLAQVVDSRRQSGQLGHLTPRERDVLELLARGLTNRAICDELYLSIKTIEPIISTIFAKLDLQPDAASNRRVLAARAYLSG